jgi:hypothetical protein
MTLKPSKCNIVQKQLNMYNYRVRLVFWPDSQQEKKKAFKRQARSPKALNIIYVTSPRRRNLGRFSILNSRGIVKFAGTYENLPMLITWKSILLHLLRNSSMQLF